MPEEGRKDMTNPERSGGGEARFQEPPFEEKIRSLIETEEGKEPQISDDRLRRLARLALDPQQQTVARLNQLLQQGDGFYFAPQNPVPEGEWTMLAGVIEERLTEFGPAVDLQSIMTQVIEGQRRMAMEIEREPQTDQEAVDLARAVLTRVEEREELFDWYSIDGSETMDYLKRIKDPEIRRQMTTEIYARRLWLALKLQWDQVSGDEKAIGELIGNKRPVLKPKMLIEMSSLAKTSEGVSLSVQISRAMNLYYNYLGIWAEEYEKPEQDRKIDRVTREAQEKLAFLDNEGRIPVLEKDGVRAEILKEMLGNLPEDLANYRNDFRVRIGQANNEQFFSLREIFGKCLWVDNMDDEDVIWTRFIVASLAGSKDAEIQALELLDFTGESDELNIIWNDNAYGATDYQKLLKVKERRTKEKESNNPHGPDATLRMYPKRSGRGWFRRAELAPGKSVRDLLREYTPFHQLNWRRLNKLTYTLDFMLPNLRSWQVFAALMTRDIDSKNLEGNSLESLNKAFRSVYGKKDQFPVGADYKSRPKTIEGQQRILENPWIAYAIGILSLHHPDGKKLPDMQFAPPENQRWSYQLDNEEKRRKLQKPTYDETFRIRMLESGFLTEDELRFVEWYCNISPRIPIAGVRF